MDQYVFCFVLCAVFYSWVPLTSLGRSHRRLDVVVVEVLLEVEVRERRAILNREELLERRIRLDVVLVLEVLLLHVVVDLAGHVGAGDQSALGLAEEDAELISDLGGDLEDGRTAGLGTLLALSLDAAAALAGILDLAVDALLKLLDLSDHGGDNLTETSEATENDLEIVIEACGRRLGSDLSGSRNRGGDGRGSHDRRSGRGSRSDLLGLLLSDRGSRCNRGRGGGNYRRHSGRNFLLRNTLGSGRGRAHRYTSTGGRIHLKQTHYEISRIQTAQFLFFFLRIRP